MMDKIKVTAEIDFTVETRGRGAVRKTKAVSATPAKLGDAVERAMVKLSDTAFSMSVRWPVGLPTQEEES